MTILGVGAAITPEVGVITFSSPENGIEYQIQYDHQGYVDAVRALLCALLPHPALMAAVLGYATEAPDGNG